MRAAQYIAARGEEDCRSRKILKELAEKAVHDAEDLCASVLGRSSCEVENNFIYVKDLWNEAASRMSRLAGAIRSRDGLEEAAEKTIEAWKKLKNSVTVKDAGELWMVFRLRDG